MSGLTLEQLADQLGAIAITVDRLDQAARAAPAAEKPKPPSLDWITVTDPEHAVKALAHVASWVQTVWTVYDPIEPCWLWHPPVVAELMACHRAWLAARSGQAPATAMAEWHSRWRLHTHRQAGKRLDKCDATTGHLSLFAVDPSRLDELAVWWAASRAGEDVPEVAPGLTRMDHT
jgi:hypothetical protein